MHAIAAQIHQLMSGAQMGWGNRPALLIIDVCKAYWSEGSPLDLSANSAARAAPDVMRQLVKAARAGRCPVLHSQVSYSGPGMEEAGLFWVSAHVLHLHLADSLSEEEQSTGCLAQGR